MKLTNRIANFRWKIRAKTRHAALSWRFLTGTCKAIDGFDLINIGENLSGCYSLESLGTESLIDFALDRWQHFPELEELAETAAKYVSRKWSGGGEVQDAAQDWALEKIKEYAEQDGISLIEV